MRRKPGDSEVSAAVGKVLERVRRDLKMGQRVASMQVGLAGHQTIRMHESGVTPITLDYFVRYCLVYGVDPVYVLAQALSEQAKGDDPSE